MDAGSIFLILALVLVVALFVGRPFLWPGKPAAAETAALTESAEHRRSSLLAERDRLLTALQELDFDNRLGKIPAEEYPAMRAALVQSAALVLRRLDEFQPAGVRGRAEDAIEQAIAARRADAAVARPAQPAVGAASDEVEELLAARRRKREEKSAGFCPQCGHPASKSDKFCAKCGAVL